MTLTQRERFIQHYITISTIRILSKKLNLQAHMSKEMIKDELDGDVELIRDTRCRKLSSEDIHKIFEDMQEEA